MFLESRLINSVYAAGHGMIQAKLSLEKKAHEQAEERVAEARRSGDRQRIAAEQRSFAKAKARIRRAQEQARDQAASLQTIIRSWGDGKQEDRVGWCQALHIVVSRGKGVGSILLLGNLHVDYVMSVMNPKSQAVWSLKELQDELAKYFYEVYDGMDHPALGQSPREAHQAGLALTGERAHRTIPYDREFLIYTLPTTARKTAKILQGRGVKVNYLYYWCESFRDLRQGDSRVEVRYDPFDLGTVYAFVDGQWLECHSEHYHAFQGRSHKEVKLAAQEIRKRWRNHSSQFPVTARKLAELLAATETQETVMAQRRADMEVRRAQADNRPSAAVMSGGKTSLSGNTWSCGAPSSAQTGQLYGEF